MEDQPPHQRERLAVEEERGERERPHRELQVRERPHRRGEAVDPALDPETTERETEDERAEHELERVRGGAEDQRQHADPGHLVHEGRGAGDERDPQEEEEGAIPTLL